MKTSTFCKTWEADGACDPCIFYLIRPFVGTTYLKPLFSRKVKKMSSATNHYQQFKKETNHYQGKLRNHYQGKLRNMVQSKKKGHNINKCFYYVKVPSNKRENKRREINVANLEQPNFTQRRQTQMRQQASAPWFHN